MLLNPAIIIPHPLGVPQSGIPEAIPLNPAIIVPRPLGDINSAMRDLDMTSDRVRALLEQGSLIGFNISAKETGCRDLRILTKSVEHYRITGGRTPLIMEWLEIFHLVLPHSKLFVRGVEISRGLNCDRGDVENLIASGCLVASKKSRSGPNGSPIITRNSYEAFLIKRLQ